MAESKNKTTSSITSTFLKCAGEGVFESLTYPLDSVGGALGNVASLISPSAKTSLLSGTYFSDFTENKYGMLAGLDKKTMSEEEKLYCDTGNFVGNIATLAIPGGAAFNALKTAEKGAKAIKIGGGLLSTTEGINLGFAISK